MALRRKKKIYRQFVKKSSRKLNKAGSGIEKKRVGEVINQ